MSEGQDKINRMLVSLDRSAEGVFKLESGVCALSDKDGREAVVIEAPDNGDMLILHSEVINLTGGKMELLYKKLLETNFSVGEMKGCWFAVEHDTVRLCTQRTIDDMDEMRFRNLVSGFIDLCLEWRKKVPALVSSSTKRPAQIRTGGFASKVL